MSFHQCLQALARPLGRRYPIHRGAPSSEAGRQTGPRGFANQATVHPNPFSSNLSTSPFAVLTKALYAEIRNKLLVVVPPHRRKFYNAREFIGTSIQAAFPSSFAELRLGGQCLAIGQ